MEQKNFNSTISVGCTPALAMEKITEVYNWWTPNFEGSARNVGDVYTVHFGDTYVTFKVSELVPDVKAVWDVTDSYLHWLADKAEWTGTQLVWALSPTNEGTQISMTHVGLIPEVECYEQCEKGWSFFIAKSLFKYISEGKGMPEMPQKDRATA